MILASFIVILIIFLGVGLASARQATGERKDYYIAGQTVSPWLAGLSAVATNNSGYLFIGVIGYGYATGLSAIWLMFGWIVGDFIGSTFIHRKLRTATGVTNEASFASVLSRWHGDDFAIWRRMAAVIMVVLLIVYGAAQITAGAKALEGVFDGFDWRIGAIGSAVIILAYSIAGGIRASIWTDAIQSICMLGALFTLFFVGVSWAGGFGSMFEQLSTMDGGTYLNLMPESDELLLTGALGVGLFVLGWLFAGFSVVGQPHIMVRFMALDDDRNMRRTRVWYYGFFVVFYILAAGLSLLARVYMPDTADIDVELALPRMAEGLLPDVLVGLILAGIFAATMSTADSVVLSCSAAITHDLVPERLEHPWMLKAATGTVTVLALALALMDSQSVFSLVIIAWSALAAAFAPLLTLYALNRRVSETTAIFLMVLGIGITLVWRFGLGWQGGVYEGFPGILIPVVIGWIMSRPATRAELQHSPAEEAAT
ncbi:sodium/proline symporter [Henriciella barbarensis]|uniref:Sodium/proline symporter n=1 Tax=Henriciella barbarensis TaxID=86342 RepID=A0A399R3X2_9PROT|nr:sodium/proline symporter [Henriciella barbarensis]RIJ24557.1 sodium/proline symporter [Henriciella barbarensis]